MAQQTNPYADSDGLPLPGQISGFLDWQDQQRQAYIDSLPEAEREAYTRDLRRMAERVASQVSVSLV